MELTPRAKQALTSARHLAHDLGHPRIGSQHLAFGLFQLGSGVHFSVLRDLGFSAESLRQAIAAEPPVGTPSSDGPQFDLSATTALDRAADEARAMQHTYTGTEHILLALLSEDSGGAAHLLASHAVDTARARQIILREYGF